MNLKTFLLIGMVGASISFITVGLIGFSDNFPVSSYFMILFMLSNGAFQCTVWPGMVTTMGNWFGKGGRGVLMGFWTGSKNVIFEKKKKKTYYEKIFLIKNIFFLFKILYNSFFFPIIFKIKF
jgi:sugar phosphate permease